MLPNQFIFFVHFLSQSINLAYIKPDTPMNKPALKVIDIVGMLSQAFEHINYLIHWCLKFFSIQ
ncbi:hypothetical protein PBOI14_48960 [Pseudomonas sp. Boi14]|nr:hypothetical protein PBOI14_48960 [Pseudomonas sp. Boi14]